MTTPYVAPRRLPSHRRPLVSKKIVNWAIGATIVLFTVLVILLIFVKFDPQQFIDRKPRKIPVQIQLPPPPPPPPPPP